MDIKKGVLAKVFDPEVVKGRKNTVKAMISTKEGINENGDAIYSSWYAHFVGDAYKKAKLLEGNEWIEIISGKVDNHYDKENSKLYVTVTVFQFKNKSE